MAGGGFDAPEPSGGRGKKKYHKGKKLGVRIDMTPMVDVIMLLLTFFMLTTTLAAPQVMQINLPKGDKTEAPIKIDAGNVLFVRVSGQGNIYVSNGTSAGSELAPQRVDLTNLRGTLEAQFAANPNVVMLLKFDRKMKYSLMVDILDEINRAKIQRKYSFLPMEESDLVIVNAAGG